MLGELNYLVMQQKLYNGVYEPTKLVNIILHCERRPYMRSHGGEVKYFKSEIA
jgi:Fe-S cluster biogenesis protein NfuA